MSKKLTEASIKMDISDFNTSDFATLSRMLELASQADSSSELSLGSIPNPVPSENAVEMSPTEELHEPTLFSVDGIEEYPDEEFAMNEELNRILQLSGITLNESEDDESDENEEELTEDAEVNGEDEEELTEDQDVDNFNEFQDDVSDFSDEDSASVGDFMQSPEFQKLMQQFQQSCEKFSPEEGEIEEGSFSGAVTGAASGALSGAKVGSIIEPGVGTVAGAAIGGIAGGIDGYNSDTVDEDFIGYDELPNEECDIDVVDVDVPEDDIEIMQLPLPRYSEAPRSTAELLRDSLNVLDEAMYDFNLDEDQANELSSPGIGDNRLFGPYQNEQSAIIDAQKEMPGSMKNVEFVVLVKPDGVYWQKKIQEDASNSRPNLEDVDQLDYLGDKRADDDKSMQKNGDNGLDDPRDTLAENISKRFKMFMKK